MLDSIVVWCGCERGSQDTALSTRPRGETGGMSENGHELREQPLTWTWTWNLDLGTRRDQIRAAKVGETR